MTATNHSLPIGNERYVRDTLFMSSERLQYSAGGGIQDIHNPVFMTTDNLFPIGTESHVVDIASISFQCLQDQAANGAGRLRSPSDESESLVRASLFPRSRFSWFVLRMRTWFYRLS